MGFLGDAWGAVSGAAGDAWDAVSGGAGDAYDWLTNTGDEEKRRMGADAAESLVGRTFSDLPPWLQQGGQQNIDMLRQMAGGQGLASQQQVQNMMQRQAKQQQAMLGSALGQNQAAVARGAAQNMRAAQGSVPGIAKAAMLQEQQGAQNLLGRALADQYNRQFQQEKARQLMFDQLYGSEMGRAPEVADWEKAVGAAASAAPIVKALV